MQHCHPHIVRLGVCLLFGTLSASAIMAGELPAFPGAEGFGAETSGGRGGNVMEVTNLNDSGPGSFQAACAAKEPRIVVFCTGGTIMLKGGIEITNPYITIAGQSAPGGGICLRNDPVNRFTPITVSTHDVVIRYLRIRPGASTEQTGYLNAMEVLSGGYNVVIDHCSLSWAVDEVFSTWYDPHDVTVQWCFITEGLDDSVHPKGPHGKGLFIGDHSTRISLHHNLIAHNVERNPSLQGGVIDVVNNVIYNPVNVPSAFSDNYNKLQVNFVGNYFTLGPNTPSTDALLSKFENRKVGSSTILPKSAAGRSSIPAHHRRTSITTACLTLGRKHTATIQPTPKTATVKLRAITLGLKST